MRQVIREFWAETGQLRNTLQSQMLEALTTGGVGARMPIIQRAEEGQRRATSQALADIDTQLAQSGLAGTPFGTEQRARVATQGQFALGQLGPQMVSQWLQQVPQYTLGGTQAVMGATAGTRETGGSGKSWQI